MSYKRLPLVVATLLITAAVSAAVNVTVNIKEWEVRPEFRAHDPLAAADGSLWYTGQRSNKLGRLDLKTGTFKEYELKTPGPVRMD